MRKVLMISPHFPPDSTAGTHRVRLLAPHLPLYGWEPTVLTVDPLDYEGRLDPTLAESVPESVRVIRSRAWPADLTRRFGVGDLGLRGFDGLRRHAMRLLGAERFDALFITIYPTYPALLGPLLKRRFGIPFVLDYQDPWVGEWGRSVGGGPARRPDFKSRASRLAASRLEPFAVRAADAVTAVSRLTYEQALARTPEARPAATDELPIGWDQTDLDFARARNRRVRRIADDGQLHLSYVGTLLPAGIDTLRAMLTAVARLRSVDASSHRLRLHFFGTSNQRTAGVASLVLPVARELGLADVVSESPERLDYFDALGVLADSAGLLLLGSSERHYTPSKVYPALTSGRPVIAALHEASTATDLLRRAGRAPSVRLVTYDDDRPAFSRVDEIAATLKAFLDDPSYCEAAIDRRVLETASARALAGRLAHVLDRSARRAA